MPEIGPRAPERTFFAVRATVPVTHMPPNQIETIWATPCRDRRARIWRLDRRPVILIGDSRAGTSEARYAREAQLDGESGKPASPDGI